MTRLDRIIPIMLAIVVVLVLSVGIIGCSGETADENGTSTPAPQPVPPDDDDGAQSDPAKDLVDTKCSLCHTLDRVYSAQMSRDEWIVTIDRMKQNGLVVTDGEYDTIVDFLAAE
jgi:cytochrome c5